MPLLPGTLNIEYSLELGRCWLLLLLLPLPLHPECIPTGACNVAVAIVAATAAAASE